MCTREMSQQLTRQSVIKGRMVTGASSDNYYLMEFYHSIGLGIDKLIYEPKH